MPAELCMSSARVLKLRPYVVGGTPLTVHVRVMASVTTRPGRQLAISLTDGREVVVQTATSAELDRWHTLLTQVLMFRPETCCELVGWVDAKPNGPPRYFELYNNGLALIYASPHRNKIGQALGVVSLSQATVAADPSHAGVWLVTDSSGVWRCTSLQPVQAGGATVEEIFGRHLRR